MKENAANLLVAAVAFLHIACLTWFFSTRRDLFIAIFSLGQYRDIPEIPAGAEFQKGMRFIANLQFAITVVFFVLWVIAWLFE